MFFYPDLKGQQDIKSYELIVVEFLTLILCRKLFLIINELSIKYFGALHLLVCDD